MMAIVLAVVVIMVAVPVSADLMATAEGPVIGQSIANEEALAAAWMGVTDFENHVAASASYSVSYCSDWTTSDGQVPAGSEPWSCGARGRDVGNPAFGDRLDGSCRTSLSTSVGSVVDGAFGWVVSKGSLSGANDEFQYILDSSAAPSATPLAYLYVTGRSGSSGRYSCQSVKAAFVGSATTTTTDQTVVVPASPCGGYPMTVPETAPVGAATMTVSVDGAAGANGLSIVGVKNSGGTPLGDPGTGGGGQRVAASFPVTAGQQFTVVLGCPGTGSVGGTGFSAGGNGATSTAVDVVGDGGGGGGATAVCAGTGCSPATPPCSTVPATGNCLLLVAGAGAGGGGPFYATNGGAGGGAGSGPASSGPSPGTAGCDGTATLIFATTTAGCPTGLFNGFDGAGGSPGGSGTPTGPGQGGLGFLAQFGLTQDGGAGSATSGGCGCGGPGGTGGGETVLQVGGIGGGGGGGFYPGGGGGAGLTFGAGGGGGGGSSWVASGAGASAVTYGPAGTDAGSGTVTWSNGSGTLAVAPLGCGSGSRVVSATVGSLALSLSGGAGAPGGGASSIYAGVGQNVSGAVTLGAGEELGEVVGCDGFGTVGGPGLGSGGGGGVGSGLTTLEGAGFGGVGGNGGGGGGASAVCLDAVTAGPTCTPTTPLCPALPTLAGRPALPGGGGGRGRRDGRGGLLQRDPGRGRRRGRRERELGRGRRGRLDEQLGNRGRGSGDLPGRRGRGGHLQRAGGGWRPLRDRPRLGPRRVGSRNRWDGDGGGLQLLCRRRRGWRGRRLLRGWRCRRRPLRQRRRRRRRGWELLGLGRPPGGGLRPVGDNGQRGRLHHVGGAGTSESHGGRGVGDPWWVPMVNDDRQLTLTVVAVVAEVAWASQGPSWSIGMGRARR